MNIPSHDFLFSWSSLSRRSRKRNAKNACFVFTAWHGGSHIQNSGPLIMFIFPEEAFKNLFFLQVNPHEANFYFPIKIVVPINMIFWNMEYGIWFFGILTVLLNDAFCIKSRYQIMLFSSVSNFFSIMK